MGVRIDQLPETLAPATDQELPAMKAGTTTKMTVAQILALGTGMPLEGGEFEGKITTIPSSIDEAGLCISPGFDPTSPLDGDTWVTVDGFKVRVGGATHNLLMKLSDAPNDGKQYARQAAQWAQVLGGAEVSVSPPPAPLPNQLWWDSDSGSLFIYYADGTSSQWVQVNVTGISDAPSDDTPYARQNGAWIKTLDGSINPAFRNKIINGEVTTNLRGSGTWTNPAAGTYFVERWAISYNGTIGNIFLSLNDMGVAYESRYALRWNQTVAGSGQTFKHIGQRIENVHTLAGRTVTLSFRASTVSGSANLTPMLIQQFGTGGSPSADVITYGVVQSGAGSGTTFNISGAGQRYVMKFVLPPVVGKTLGTTISTDSLGLYFNLPLNATFDLLLWEIQLEDGPVATPFERLPISVVRSMLDRYWQTHPFRILATVTAANQYVSISRTVAQRMRVIPTTVVNSLTASNVLGGSFGYTWQYPNHYQIYMQSLAGPGTVISDGYTSLEAEF